MTAAALTMMIISMVVVWGGLAASVMYLRSRPEVLDGPGAVDPDADDELG